MAANNKQEPLLETGKSVNSNPIKKWGVFVAFVCTDVGKVLAFSWAVRGTAAHSQIIVICQSVCSIIIGTIMSGVFEGMNGIKLCFNVKLIGRFFAVAMMFSFQQTLGALQYVSLSPATAKVLAQVRLPILALGSSVVVNKKYSLLQWVGLILITFTAILFCETKQMVAGGSAKKNTAAGGLVFGYVCSLTASLFSVIAGLLSERFLKDQKKTPFYTQKVQIEVGGLIVGIAMLFIMPVFAEVMNLDNKDSLNALNPRTEYDCGESGLKTLWGKGPHVTPAGCSVKAEYTGELFDGWTIATVVCLTLLMGQSWMAGYMAKAMSQVMKQVGQCASLLFTYFLGDCLIFQRSPFNIWVTLVAFLVAGSMGFFFYFEEGGHK